MVGVSLKGWLQAIDWDGSGIEREITKEDLAVAFYFNPDNQQDTSVGYLGDLPHAALDGAAHVVIAFVDGSREGCEREAADILWKQGNRDGIAGDRQLCEW